MQIIRTILKIGANGAELANENGSTENASLEIMLGTAIRLEFELHSDNGSTTTPMSDYPLSGLSANSYYFALNETLNCNTPKLLRTAGITLSQESSGHSVFAVEIPNTAVDTLVAAMGSKATGDFNCELGGFDSDGVSVFAWQFGITVRGRLYLGGGTASITGDPAYYTAPQVEAAIGRQLFFEYSADGSTWHAALTTGDLWQRVRHGSQGTPSAAQSIPYGPAGANGSAGADGSDGEDGEDGAGLMIDDFGTLADRPAEIDYSPFCYYATDTELAYFWNGSAWSSGITLPGVAFITTTDTANSAATIANVQGGYKYKYGTLSSLTLTAVENSDTEAVIIFTSGSTATTLDAPSTVLWADGSLPMIEANMTYTISIQNNLAVCAGFKAVTA